MLKPKYYNINIRVYVSDTSKSFLFNVSIHTTMKEIGILVADNLGLDIFRTEISFRTRYNYIKLNPSSTLNQNKITTNNCELYANIDTISTKPVYNENEIRLDTNLALNNNLSLLDFIDKFPAKQVSLTYGLNAEGICIDKKCIYFRREVVCPLGVGTFPLTYILKNLKCPACPYKSLDIDPAIVIKNLKFKTCVWKIKGFMKMKNKIEFPSSLENWNIVEGENSSQFYESLEENCWSSVEIEVKPLHTFKQSNYQKYSYQGNSFNFLDDFVNYHR